MNEVARHFLGAAFGGYKQSGIGREFGTEGLAENTEVKAIALPPGSTVDR